MKIQLPRQIPQSPPVTPSQGESKNQYKEHWGVLRDWGETPPHRKQIKGHCWGVPPALGEITKSIAVQERGRPQCGGGRVRRSARGGKLFQRRVGRRLGYTPQCMWGVRRNVGCTPKFRGYAQMHYTWVPRRDFGVSKMEITAIYLPAGSIFTKA